MNFLDTAKRFLSRFSHTETVETPLNEPADNIPLLRLNNKWRSYVGFASSAVKNYHHGINHGVNASWRQFRAHPRDFTGVPGLERVGSNHPRRHCHNR